MKGVRVVWQGRFGGGKVVEGMPRGGRVGPPFRGCGWAIVRFVGVEFCVLGERREKGRRLCVRGFGVGGGSCSGGAEGRGAGGREAGTGEV